MRAKRPNNRVKLNYLAKFMKINLLDSTAIAISRREFYVFKTFLLVPFRPNVITSRNIIIIYNIVLL